MAQQLKQLEELNKKLTGDQMDRNEAHAKELDKCEKERKKELSNFHRIYAEKMKRQAQKYVVEVMKVVEAMKEDKEFYKTHLKEEQENHEKQEKQLMELMQGLLVVTQQKKWSMKY